MRGYEKEIIASQLKDEKYVIRQLKLLYSKSLQQIDGKIEELLGKYDATQLQSVIYQLDHQKALKQQISGILDTLQADEYETISDYLTKCYENGFMGSMYSMNKQGVPLILPFDQEQVINAIVHDSKISKGLYEALGFNMKDLKKRISAEVSRGIANGMSYQEIARNLRNTSSVGINNATRIARTEGHRIQAQSQLDACNHAKKKGADVVKQWDATLDGRTRPHHRKLDGQIREIDDFFEVNGKKAKAPSQFGRPEEDINCRCVLLQRARWGLDEEELKTLEERAEFYGLDKTEDFEEFKEKYLKAIEKEIQQEIIEPRQPNVQMSINNFPSAFSSKPKSKKNAQMLSEYINNQPNADPNVVELYSQMGNMAIGDNFTFDVGFGQNNAVTNWTRLSGEVVKQKITLQDLTKNGSLGAYQTNLHELGHLIDSNINKNGKYYSSTIEGYKDILSKNANGISDEVKELFEHSKKQYIQIEDEIVEKYRTKLSKITQDYKDGKYGSYTEYKKAWDKVYKERNEAIDIAKRNVGTNNLQDIYDALSGGVYRSTGVVKYGHGTKYYSSYKSRMEEIFANYMSLSVTNPELIEMLRRDKPELVSLLEEMVKTMLKGGN